MTPSEGDPDTLDDVEFDVDFSEFPPGTQLNNTYKVIGEIREGGMATIYEVEHVRQGTRHAAKVLKPGLLDDKHVSRMEREARVATSIHHPNVLRVTNMEETPGGRPFLVCDRLHGEDLRDRLARGPLSIDHALEYAAQTASAVAMVHRAEVVHRDIKPENLFLVDYGDGRPADVRLLDFGIARVDDGIRLTNAGAVMGSPKYMAPEQAADRSNINGQADVYTLGLILYEMLVGAPPFESERPLDIMSMQIEAAPPRPSLRRSEISRAVERVVLKALEKDPARRHDGMPQFLAALQTCRRKLRLPPARVPSTRGSRPPSRLRNLWAVFAR